MGNIFSIGISQALVAADAGTWKTAIQTFAVGFSTVFVCLGILMCSLYLSGYLIGTWENRRKEGKDGA
ncbi:MAG: OadG family protein [Deltaproteobacteria bacterium]|nr:OadG family protein [Deltaproteobacteria bacterium]